MELRQKADGEESLNLLPLSRLFSVGFFCNEKHCLRFLYDEGSVQEDL